MNSLKTILTAIGATFCLSGTAVAADWVGSSSSTVDLFILGIEEHGVIVNHELIDPLVIQRNPLN